MLYLFIKISTFFKQLFTKKSGLYFDSNAKQLKMNQKMAATIM
jgi:hypothetical protein